MRSSLASGVARFAVAACALGLAGGGLAGCDSLFPELFGGSADMVSTSTDLASTDMAGDAGVVTPQLQGQVCVITDVRDYRSCATSTFASDLRITVEETRDQVMTDLNGKFTLPLTATITTATVAVVDPAGHYQTTVIPLTLSNGAVFDLALPLVPAASVTAMASNDATTLDPNRGVVLAWAIDEVGLPVAGVSANVAMLADGDSSNALLPASATGSRGAIGVVNSSVGSLTLTLTTPAASAVIGDSFILPVRAGAITTTRLVLLPR
jgi:hypothetical protein